MEITRGLSSSPRAARKTHQVTASTGTTAIDLFTITGRVLILTFTAYCTETINPENGDETIEVGGATDPNGILPQITASTLDVTEWWVAAATGGVVPMPATTLDMLTDEDIILTVAGTTGYDDGTVVYDVRYIPVTDDGALAAA